MTNTQQTTPAVFDLGQGHILIGFDVGEADEPGQAHIEDAIRFNDEGHVVARHPHYSVGREKLISDPGEASVYLADYLDQVREDLYHAEDSLRAAEAEERKLQRYVKALGDAMV